MISKIYSILLINFKTLAYCMANSSKGYWLLGGKYGKAQSMLNKYKYQSF